VGVPWVPGVTDNLLVGALGAAVPYVANWCARARARVARKGTVIDLARHFVICVLMMRCACARAQDGGCDARGGPAEGVRARQ
jgi:hypothetical protein